MPGAGWGSGMLSWHPLTAPRSGGNGAPEVSAVLRAWRGFGAGAGARVTPPAVCLSSLDPLLPWRSGGGSWGSWVRARPPLSSAHRIGGPCGCGRAAPPPTAETPPGPGRARSHDSPPSLLPRLLPPLGSATPPRSLPGCTGGCAVGGEGRQECGHGQAGCQRDIEGH